MIIPIGNHIGAESSTINSSAYSLSDTLLIDNNGFYIVDSNDFYIRLESGIGQGNDSTSATYSSSTISASSISVGSEPIEVTISSDV